MSPYTPALLAEYASSPGAIPYNSVRHVADEGENVTPVPAELPGRPRQRLTVLVDQADPGALPQKMLRSRLADAACRSRDQARFPSRCPLIGSAAGFAAGIGATYLRRPWRASQGQLYGAAFRG